MFVPTYIKINVICYKQTFGVTVIVGMFYSFHLQNVENMRVYTYCELKYEHALGFE